MPASLTIRAGVTIRADPEQVWDLAIDWSRQREWIWATRTHGGHGLGASVIAWTGIGPVGFSDTMLITEWDPPRRCTVTHTGKIVRGHGIFEVLPRATGCELRWTERIEPPLPQALLELLPARLAMEVTRIACAVIAPAARIGLGTSLVRFARLVGPGR